MFLNRLYFLLLVKRGKMTSELKTYSTILQEEVMFLSQQPRSSSYSLLVLKFIRIKTINTTQMQTSKLNIFSF